MKLSIFLILLKLFKLSDVRRLGILLTVGVVFTISGSNILKAQTPIGTPLQPAVPLPLPSGYTSPVINYVRTWEPAGPTSDTAYVAGPGRTPSEVRQTTQYFDGLGRPIQTVAKAMSFGGKDIVEPVVYDAFGRKQTEYLTYIESAATDGKFKTTPFNAQSVFYQGLTPNEKVYYTRIDYEASPLNRVIKTYAPGASWAKNDLSGVERGGNRPVERQYLINTTADSVRIWDFTGGLVIPVSGAGQIYAAGQLYKNMIIEDRKSVV